MEFKIITTYPKKRTYAYQLKAILQFDSDELATKAYRSIIGSTMAGQLMPCKTYHVDNYLVLCAYEETFDQLIEFLKNLDPADADNTARTHFWDSFFHSDNWADIVDAAYDYFHDCFPEQTDWEDDNYLFQFTYRKTTFFAEMPDSSVDGTKVKFYADEDGTEFLFAIGLTDDPRKIIDDFIGKQKPAGESKVTPESAMFAAMKDIDFAKALPKDTERKLKGIANLFFQSWLKDASVFGVEASDDIAAFNWVEAWFLYKGKKYHLDFCMEDGNNTLCLYTTNKYQENIDCAYVTVDTLQEKIDSVDDAGHFPGFPGQVIPACPREDVDELDREIPRKSLEERLDKVERLIASLQDEVTEIKKKI